MPITLKDSLIAVKTELEAIRATLAADEQFRAFVELDLAVSRIELVLEYVQEPSNAGGAGTDQVVSDGGTDPR